MQLVLKSLVVVLSATLCCNALAQETLWTALNNQVVQLFGSGNYDEAIEVAQKSLKVAEDTFGLKDARVAASLNNLAALYQLQGEYYLSEALFKRALTIWDQEPFKNKAKIVTLMRNLIEVYSSQGDTVQADLMSAARTRVESTEPPPPPPQHQVRAAEDEEQAVATVEEHAREEVEPQVAQLTEEAALQDVVEVAEFSESVPPLTDNEETVQVSSSFEPATLQTVERTSFIEEEASYPDGDRPAELDAEEAQQDTPSDREQPVAVVVVEEKAEVYADGERPALAYVDEIEIIEQEEPLVPAAPSMHAVEEDLVDSAPAERITEDFGSSQEVTSIDPVSYASAIVKDGDAPDDMRVARAEPTQHPRASRTTRKTAGSSKLFTRPMDSDIEDAEPSDREVESDAPRSVTYQHRSAGGVAGLTVDEQQHLAWLIDRSKLLLNDDERQRLFTLHELYRGDRSRRISPRELEEMRELHDKALRLLPAYEQSGFHELLLKSAMSTL